MVDAIASLIASQLNTIVTFHNRVNMQMSFMCEPSDSAFTLRFNIDSFLFYFD